VRLGGNGFVLGMPTHAVPNADCQLVRNLQAARSLLEYGSIYLTLSASVGARPISNRGISCVELPLSADGAIYRIENNGCNSCHLCLVGNTHVLAEQQSSIIQRLALHPILLPFLRDDGSQMGIVRGSLNQRNDSAVAKSQCGSECKCGRG
jgi:hypothetical protein